MSELLGAFKKATRIGLGSGRTVAEFLEAGMDAKVIHRGAIYFASSSQIAIVADRLGLTLGDPSLVKKLHVVVDGADQVLPNGWFVKGGGGALLREKLLWKQSDMIFVLATLDKKSNMITVPVPVEVHPWGVNLLVQYIHSIGGSAQLRKLERGSPVITENGNFIIDATFKKKNNPKQYQELATGIKNLTGVIEVGLFHDDRAVVYHPVP